jgi:colanic acid/amylovoran biosynthesis glycosyltransferase
MRAITVVQAAPGVWLEPTQTWLYTQVINLPAHVESHVFCEATRSLDVFPFPRIHSLENDSRRMQLVDRLLRKLRVCRHFAWAKRARELGARLVHSHFGNTAWEFLPVARACRARHVVSFYGFDVNRLPRRGPWLARYAEVFREVDLVLCEGPHMARCLQELGCPANKVAVHHLGVPVHEIPFTPRTWTRNERLRVLMAASFKEKKGLPRGIEALGLLRGSLDLELTIIGGSSPSTEGVAEEQRIHAAIDRAGLRNRVKLLGYQPQRVLHEEARKHHLFLAPSLTAADGDTEGGAPVTLIEMAALGIPIVSTRHCDVPGVIEDEVTGLLAPEADTVALAERIERMVEISDGWATMLVAGRRRVEASFDARTQGVRLAELYAELVDASSP